MILQKVFDICDEFYKEYGHPVTDLSVSYPAYDDLWGACCGVNRGPRSPWRLMTKHGEVLVTINPFMDGLEYAGLVGGKGFCVYKDFRGDVKKPEVEKKKCNCPIHIVFNFGCKCGGV